MPVFHDKKAIFIHIPKTAGTTINKMFGITGLNPNYDVFYNSDEKFEYDHIYSLFIKNRYPKKYKEYYKFAVVRNPYDRLVSEYFHKKTSFDKRFFDVSNLTFAEFVEKLPENYENIFEMKQKDISHFLSQSSYVCSDVEIYKFEKIDECLDTLAKKFNLARPTVKEHTTDHAHWETYYNDELKSIVYDLYYVDFKVFGYEK